MHQSLFVFIFGVLCVSSTGRKYETKSVQYSVPKATIKAFQSKGFSVSIPDSAGLRLFAFHGNLNSNLATLEAGTFSKDVLQPENGLWIFKDTSIQLKVGDVINYWLFVEKDGLGYRQDLQKFVVKGKLLCRYIFLYFAQYLALGFQTEPLKRHFFDRKNKSKN